jgi:glucose-1-phosphate adenylyltransferase
MNIERNLSAIIMGGGRGERLYPLTQYRAKPAVSIGGKYRLIDIPVSNCIHSHIKNIYILTQVNTASLHRHIFQTYKFDMFTEGIIEILAAQQTLESTDWFQGTADAVRSYWNRFSKMSFSNFLILAGDHLYNMDYRKFFQHHLDSDAELTIATIPIPVEDAGRYGIMATDSNDNITDFIEKPNKEQIKPYIKKSELGEYVLASMGIYIYKKNVLNKALKFEGNDFGKNIIPATMKQFKTSAYKFDGNWEDIGTIGAYFNSNIALTDPVPEFNFYEEKHRLFTHPRFLPGSKIEGANITSSIINEGCRIGNAKINRSIVGIRSIITDGVELDHVVHNGADYYSNDGIGADVFGGIGENTIIKRAIIDKNVIIGKNIILENRNNIEEADLEYCAIRNGIIVVPARTEIPDGWSNI